MSKIQSFYKTQGPISVILSVVLSVLLVVGFVEAATTISTNISTGGTLSVTGASTLTGAVNASSTTQVTGALTTYGNGTFGDASTDINLFTGALHASSTSLFTSGLTTYGGSTFGDAAGDINLFTGTLHASSTALFTSGLTTYGNSTFGDAAEDINLFTGALHASSTALFTSGLTTYGNLTINQAATTTVTFNSAGINFDANTFVLDPNANRIGVLTATPNTAFEVVGTASTTNLVVGGGTSISRHISTTASLDFPSIGANSCQSLTITATGAADGDTVSLGVPNALASASSTLVFSGWVSAADTVTVRVCQVAGQATSDPAAATVRADVWKH